MTILCWVVFIQHHGALPSITNLQSVFAVLYIVARVVHITRLIGFPSKSLTENCSAPDPVDTLSMFVE